MSTVTTNRRIDLNTLPFPATMKWDGATATIEAAGKTKAELQAAVDGAPVDNREADDAAVSAFIAGRLPSVLDKAKAIMADPVGAPDFTAIERKVILAANLLDLNQRRR